METSVKAADVVVPAQPEVASSPPDAEGAAAPPAASSSSSSSFDPMEEFSRRLQDIVSSYGAASGVLDKLTAVEAETEKMKKEAKDDIAVATETEVSAVMQSLKQLKSPEKKLEDLVRRHAEMAALRRCDEKKLCVLQQRLSVLLDERQQLQAEARSSVAARSQLEALCRELQEHYAELREETLRRCREDEQKRAEMTGHFQTMLTEIQAQIEQHSARNDKLCRENSNLTDKLEGLMTQCEHREESLEKINERRDLQHKLTEAKLQQANALLSEAEEKHKREKEYLLREAIEKTKKCFAMKEQELAMKKKLLVQAAEWKLQAQTYREQGTVMQAQLTLYAQKFDEFQETLAKSNEIYVRFKKEMDNMSDKMKKMEKESNLWKTRFENCNKALTDMIQERTEKSKEYDVFVLKIQKLEKLCHALQAERVMLYDKIKEVRQSNADIPAKIFSGLKPEETQEAADKSAVLTPVEVQEIQEEDPVLTEGMTRLKEEQARLQEFAAALLATPSDDEDEEVKDDLETEEDLVASAFDGFKSKPKVVKEPASVPERVEEVKPAPPQPDEPEEVPKPSVEKTSEEIPADPKPEEVKAQSEDKEMQPVKPKEEIQQQPAKPEKDKISPPTGLEPEPAQAETLAEAQEVKPVIPVKEGEALAEPEQEAPTKPVSAKASPGTSSSTSDASKKQTPKKKKKRNGKSAS